MYHDKRFQRDNNFHFAVFSHRQLKQSSNQGYLVTDRPKFDDISNRILNIKIDVMTYISEGLKKNGFFNPKSEDEKECYQLLRDIDLVAGKVDGSLSSKKFYRNELYSLMLSEGAPSWYVTLTPSDFTHPICLYWATENEKFDININLKGQNRQTKIIENPAAAARFFNFMIETFITHILGVGGPPDSGVFGNISWYYGINEE
ncbi:hypothetical protein BDZ89DRAFT_946844, partial [Hymenopellis radicata]